MQPHRPNAICVYCVYTIVLTLIWTLPWGVCTAQEATPAASTRFAGNGQPSRSDGSAPQQGARSATSTDVVKLGNPFGVEIIGKNVWITTVDDQCIWKTSIDSESLVRVAGNGRKGYSGDEGLATEAEFNWPHEVRIAADGTMFVADTRNHVIRRIDPTTNIVTTLAGNGKPGFAGDGEPKQQGTTQFDQPHSVVLDQNGGLLVADTKNHRLRRIDLSTGVVETVSGNGQRRLPKDGQNAEQASLFGPRSLAVDEKSIWLALREGNSIWRIDRTAWTIHHVAGTGAKGYSGDGGSPKEATLSGPKGIAVDSDGNVLIVDTENHAIRKILLNEDRIETVLGGSKAEQTLKLKRPHGIAGFDLDGKRHFLVGDSENHQVIQGTTSR